MSSRLATMDGALNPSRGLTGRRRRLDHGWRAPLLGVCSCAMAIVGSAAARTIAAEAGPSSVDLALVLALDVSGTVSPGQFDLQRQGYAEAFASPELVKAIRSAEGRAIAVTLVQWSGARQQEQVLGWTLIDDEASSQAFARQISKLPRSFYGRTSISEAIDFSADLLAKAPFRSARKIIDVSGDGVSNDGDPLILARSKALNEGLTINGLPIANQDDNVDEYYMNQVIGGPGSFVMPISSYDQFGHAILKKLVREIAGTGFGRGDVDRQLGVRSRDEVARVDLER